MRSMTCSALALMLAGVAACSPGGSGVYEMTVDEAMKKLRSAHVAKTTNAFESPFLGLDVSVRSPAPGTLAWSAEGEPLCTATVTQVDEKHVSVSSHCPGIDPDTGAPAATEGRLGPGMKEFVASTLEGRSFDSSVVMSSMTAGAAANYPRNVKDALEAERNLRSGKDD